MEGIGFRHRQGDTTSVLCIRRRHPSHSPVAQWKRSVSTWRWSWVRIPSGLPYGAFDYGLGRQSFKLPKRVRVPHALPCTLSSAARTLGLHPSCRGFESLSVYHASAALTAVRLFRNQEVASSILAGCSIGPSVNGKPAASKPATRRSNRRGPAMGVIV